MLFDIFCLQKVKVNERNTKGENARALAMMYGYTKIVSLIDSQSPRIKLGICSEPNFPASVHYIPVAIYISYNMSMFFFLMELFTGQTILFPQVNG